MIDISLVGIISMLTATIFALALPRGDRRQVRAISVFAFGAVLIVTDWLMDDPTRLETVQNELAVALIGLIFFFIQVLKRRG